MHCHTDDKQWPTIHQLETQNAAAFAYSSLRRASTQAAQLLYPHLCLCDMCRTDSNIPAFLFLGTFAETAPSSSIA